MIPARVLAIAKDTGKVYQAMRSEFVAQPVYWDWTETSHNDDIPFTGGDVVFRFPSVDSFPRTPPKDTNAKGADEKRADDV